jgi:hypothetical protein
MKIKQFIKDHRKEIDRIVKMYYGDMVRNDKERHEWILSDEGLYRWAQQEGVNI